MMHTIENYLETMFINLPETNELAQLKQDLLANMEDKYNELKDEGKSENEAIGVVISEFGNIDEILKEMGMDEELYVESVLPLVSIDDALQYISDKKRIGLGIGVGIVLCTIGVGLLIASDGYNEILGLVSMFVFAAMGVGQFIVSGFRDTRLSHFQKDFVMTGATRQVIEEEKKNYERSHIVSIVVGVVICILSLVPMFLLIDFGAENIGVSLMLVIASFGVIFFVYTGNAIIAFDSLLKYGKKTQPTEKELKEKKVRSLFGNIYWPVVVIIYFVWSFSSPSRFAYSWLIFIVAAVGESVVKAFFGIYDEDD